MRQKYRQYCLIKMIKKKGGEERWDLDMHVSVMKEEDILNVKQRSIKILPNR